MNCPLCQNSKPHAVYKKIDPVFGPREYEQCPDCKLIYLLPQYFFSLVDEKNRYDLHQNHPDDQGYVDFLNLLIEPLSGYVPEGSTGVDYGCGPGPTVSVLLQKKGIKAVNFDPVYFPDEKILAQAHDFITATEVVEHFHQPRREMLQFDRMLKPGGHVGLMTYLYVDVPRFKDGWYHLDPTHVSFYHRETMEWIARWLKWKVEYLTGRVVIFSKP